MNHSRIWATAIVLVAAIYFGTHLASELYGPPKPAPLPPRSKTLWDVVADCVNNGESVRTSAVCMRVLELARDQQQAAKQQ